MEHVKDVKKLKSTACEAVDSATGKLYALSNDIWSHPELAWNEHHAHKILTEFLTEQGFLVEKHYLGLETAFRATVGEGRPHVAVLCEYDALPDIGHACGHNLIAEVGIGAGIAIKAAMETADAPSGTLTVLGTPAEEGAGGKVVLVRKGAFDDFDVCMMAHPWPEHAFTDTGNWLARDYVNVTYTGKPVHASGAPWEGINALDAAVLAYNNISCLRQQMKPDCRIHGIIKNGGVRPTIIPEKSELQFYTRAPTTNEMKGLKEKVVNCLQGAALATGCGIEMKWCDLPYDNLLSNKVLGDLYEENCKEIGVQFCHKRSSVGLLCASTDMGNVSHTVPSIHPVFYTGQRVFNHSRPFTAAAGSKEAQQFTLEQAKALAMTAIDVLCQQQLIPHIKEEFKKDLHRDATS